MPVETKRQDPKNNSFGLSYSPIQQEIVDKVCVRQVGYYLLQALNIEKICP